MLSNNIENYLNQIKIPLHLSCTTKSGWPIGLSLWYLYNDGYIYCATQKSARVVKYLINDHRCSYEVSSDQPPYCGVRGQAVARIDYTLGPKVLELLLIRYLGGLDSPLAENLLKKSSSEVAIVLTPKNVFTWNYTERMRSSIRSSNRHPCP